jgi:hypothetical protein
MKNISTMHHPKLRSSLAFIANPSLRLVLSENKQEHIASTIQ